MTDAIAEARAAGGVASPRISAIVISRNEAALLEECLPLLSEFDEVLVCDMASTDDTRVVAETYGARLLDVPVVRIAEAVRQRALDAALSDWVLFVDADERVPAGYAERVRTLIADAPDVCAWRLRYANIAFGRRLEHTLVNSAKIALLRRDRCSYSEEQRAHLPPDVDGPIADAPDSLPLIGHLSYRSVEQGVEKTLRYAAGYGPDPRVLEPWGFLRHAARLLLFSGVWRDGRAGLAIGTMTLFGHWYGAARRAEEAGELSGDLTGSQRGLLEAATWGQRSVVGGRDAVRSRWRRRSSS